ncbi:anthrax toxin-like adenylyl cyclase domain-containing protein [Thiolinea disciformis]|uniref:anthrax toxin-like adenylyl cyclase domain-containing protein n=1 Tax=Thiolinea disciformis TaxID=125614 RepID=UPI00037DCC22|nr:anthrax toxin-like adenylyl cyclase domain-containing protein [Thiolinea disciformis]
MLSKITPEQLKKEGISEAHKKAFLQVAKGQNCIILTRTPGEACEGLLAEGYDAKSFHVKAKSCQSGVAAGFICFDPFFNKNAIEGLADNLYENNKSLNNAYEQGAAKEKDGSVVMVRSGTTELRISEERVNWLLSKKYIIITSEDKKNKIGLFIQGNKSYSFKLEWDTGTKNWKVLYKPSEIYTKSTEEEIIRKFEEKNTKKVKEGKEEIKYQDLYKSMKEKIGSSKNDFAPLLIMTNPHLNYTSEQAYLNAVVGDYDLFAIWPVKSVYEENPARFSRIVDHESEETVKNMSNKIVETESTNKIGKVVGNISNAVFNIAQLINSVIGAHCPKESKVNRVFHSDEGGRPFVDAVDTAVAFTPNGECYLLEAGSGKENNGQALVKFAEEVFNEGYHIIINVGWKQAFKNSTINITWPK